MHNLGAPQAPGVDRQRCPRCQGSDHFSASRIETFLDCPRKWAWSKLDRLPDTPNRFAQFGLELHAQVEGYLAKGKPLDLTTQAGEAAMAGVHLLPPPGYPGMQIEPHFDLYAWGHKFVGHKDIQLVPSAPLMIHGKTFEPGIPIVWDHKSTGDFQWAKSDNQEDVRIPRHGGPPEDFYLGRNIQNVMYAVAAMQEAKAPAADTRWVYYLRNKPHGAKAVDVRHTRESVLPTLAKIKDAADQMARWKASGLKALDLPYNANMCDKFGGCAFRSNCNLNPLEKLQGFLSNAERLGQMSNATPDAAKAAFLASVAAAQAAQGGAGQAMNPPPGPTTGSGGVPGLPEGATIQNGQYWAPGMTGWLPLPEAAPTPPPMPQAPPPMPMQNPGPPNPPPGATPQQPPPMPQATQAPLPTTMPWARPDAVVQGGNYWLPGMTDWQPIPAGQVPPAQPEAPKRGPGRPPGSNTDANTLTDAKVLASLVRLLRSHMTD